MNLVRKEMKVWTWCGFRNRKTKGNESLAPNTIGESASDLKAHNLHHTLAGFSIHSLRKKESLPPIVLLTTEGLGDLAKW